MFFNRQAKEKLLSVALFSFLSFALGTSAQAVPNPTSVCSTSSAAWTDSALPVVEKGSFRVTFDATPLAAKIDGITGLSSGPAAAYSSLAAIVRFNASGTIDARNGGAYSAASAIPYSAGVTYSFILDVNITSHVYNAYVIVGGAQTTIGTGLAFRIEQAGVASLNYVGSITSTGNHTICNVAIAAGAATAPVVTGQPTSETVATLQNGAFYISGTGTAPLTYQWSKNGVAISGATSSIYITPSAVASDNGSKFTVSLANSAGVAVSNAATLSVRQAALSLASSLSNVSFGNVGVSGTSTKTVILTNTGDNNITISNIGVSGPFQVAGVPAGQILTIGQTVALNVTFAPTAAGSATGSIVVSSNATISQSTITLSGTGGTQGQTPTITGQPAATTIATGQNAAFYVAATGTAPMKFQWAKNGAAINGATSSVYITPAATAADNGAKFSVTLTNTGGSAASSAATLTVRTPSLVLGFSPGTLSFGSVNLSSSTSKTVTLTNAGDNNITISNISIAGAGFNASGVPVGSILTIGETMALNVTFSPAVAGSATGSVTVSSNATGASTVALSGAGVSQQAHSVSLTWTASATTGAVYNTYSSSVSGGPYAKLNPSQIAGTQFTDAAISSGKTYYYVVTAVDANNLESVYSSEIAALIP